MSEHSTVVKTKQDLELEDGIEKSIQEVQGISLDDIGKILHEGDKVMAVIQTPDNRKLILYDCGPEEYERQGQMVKVFMEG